MINKINTVLERACRVVSGVSLVFMGLIAFVDSIGRPLSHPLPGASEMVSFALMVFFFSSLPLVVKSDSHIRVGLFSDFYGPKARKIESVVVIVLETLAMAAFAWMIFDQAGRLGRFGTQSVYFEMPIAPWVYLACLFSAFAIWFAVWPLLSRGISASHSSDKVD